MRPCQNCNAAIGNADKHCPACGAEQVASVGFQKAPPQSGEAASDSEAQELSGPESWLAPFALSVVLDPSMCIIGVVLLLFFLFIMSPGAALIVFAISAILTIVAIGIINGG